MKRFNRGGNSHEKALVQFCRRHRQALPRVRAVLRRRPARQMLLDEALHLLPTARAQGLHGGVKYWDGQFNDARLALALARTFMRKLSVSTRARTSPARRPPVR